MPGRVAGVPFHLGVGHRNAHAAGEDASAVGDDRDEMITFDLETVGLVGVSLATAGNARVVGLLERLEPLTDIFRPVRLLPVVARVGDFDPEHCAS